MGAHDDPNAALRRDGDQDAGQKALYVDFFGRPASTHKAIALLALEFQVPMLVMLALPWGGTGGRSLATPGAAHAGPLVAGTTYVVRQGDTLWGIAARLASGSDPRPLVARLESEAGGDVVHPGQPLLLP